MNLDVACVAIAFDRKVMESIFSQSQSAAGIFEGASERDFFVFDSTTNNNIVDFEHNLGYNGGHTILVKLVDTTNNFNNMVAAAEGQRVYVTYGASRDLRDWAKPMACILASAKLEVFGSPVINLSLIPTNEEVDSEFMLDQYGVQISGNETGLYSRYSGKSQAITFQEGAIQYVGGDFSYHRVVCDTLRDYLSKVTGTSNVLINLPDIDKVCSKAITNAERDAGFSKVAQVRKVLGLFGISLELQLSKDKSVIPPSAKVGVAGPVIQRNNYSNPIASVNTFNALEFRATISSEVEANPLVYFNRVINGINRRSSTYKILDPRVSYENSLDILSFWRGLSEDSWSFGGYGSFDDKDFAVVAGDSRFIQNYLYGFAAQEGSKFKLFPEDSKAFSSNYLRDIQEIQFPSFTPGDEFSITLPETSAEFVPEFRYNVVNPNVASLRLKTTSIYFALLNKLLVQTDKAATNGLRVQQKPESSVTEVAASGLGIDAFIGERDEIDAQDIVDREFLQAIRKGLILEIDTLPRFYLSRLATINQKANLQAKTMPVIGVTNQSLVDELLTGQYRITGFRHKISGGDISSQFQLTSNRGLDNE